MADKISDLPPAAAAFLVDEDECNQSGVSRRVSNTQRMALFKANQYDQDLDTTDNVTFNNIDSTGIIKTDTVDEKVLNAGVTVDTVLIKDGLVDGVNVSALQTDVDGFPDELKNLTTAEIVQLENIDTTTISTAQWVFVGGADQAVKTSDGVTFNSVTLSTPSGTPTALDYYEEFSTTLTFDFSANVWTSSINTTGLFYRVGKIVTFVFSPSLIGTTNGAPATNIDLSAGTLIPARFRPGVSVSGFVRTIENNVGLAPPGVIIFSTTGDITIIKDGASSAWGANLPNTGVFAGSYSWITS